MTKIAIQAVGLGKQYRIGERQEKYKMLRDTLTDVFTAPARRLSGLLRKAAPADETSVIWALQDASFEIEQGEIVGVIGRNGAGKSTLLKILSRITEPTTGYADVTGRVRSLLEVGTGFHQELTGRENIILNGAILGMKRGEIERKFDEIVAFAEVERFIDTPVKRYSSGMYLRLAFAVAAHLEPEILLIDEVLAVGDAAFQKKCLGKMGDVASEGRMVLFVSHNLGAVKELCRTGILLDGGRVRYQGGAADCIVEYMKGFDLNPEMLDVGMKQLALGQMRIQTRRGDGVNSGEPFKVTLSLAADDLRNPMIFFILEDFLGSTILHHRVNSRDIGAERLHGTCELSIDLPALWLTPGIYSAYFKFLLPETDAGPGRAKSEKMMIEIHGEFGNAGRAVLSPTIEWSLTPAAQVSRQGGHG